MPWERLWGDTRAHITRGREQGPLEIHPPIRGNPPPGCLKSRSGQCQLLMREKHFGELFSLPVEVLPLFLHSAPRPSSPCPFSFLGGAQAARKGGTVPGSLEHRAVSSKPPDSFPTPTSPKLTPPCHWLRPLASGMRGYRQLTRRTGRGH